ncbi:MAG: hypothetical protein ACQ9MH_23340, partial [Nitrospinales bacterium]
EITVPITYHSKTKNDHGFGIIVNWMNGHYDVDGSQPYWGWNHIGALGWYHNENIEIYQPETRVSQALLVNHTYIFKMRVVHRSDDNIRYCLKVWEEGTSEPEDWTVDAWRGRYYAYRTGGIALVSYNVDVTFGNISVYPISAP